MILLLSQSRRRLTFFSVELPEMLFLLVPSLYWEIENDHIAQSLVDKVDDPTPMLDKVIMTKMHNFPSYDFNNSIFGSIHQLYRLFCTVFISQYIVLTKSESR